MILNYPAQRVQCYYHEYVVHRATSSIIR